MTPFRSLIDHVPGLSPGELQDRARQELPGRVMASALCLWTPDQERPNDREFLLVGVAVWSGYDMNLLDYLNAAVAKGTRPDIRVYVFDAGSGLSQDDLAAIVPGIGSVHHTPVVGHWQNDTLVEKECGFHGRQIVARLFGIDEQLLHQRITAAS